MSASSSREETLFEQALSLGAVAEREAWIRQACGEDSAMCERLLGLLRAHERAGGFLGRPGPSPAVRICERCGRPMSPHAPQSLCAICLLQSTAGMLAGADIHAPGSSEAVTNLPVAEQPGQSLGRYRLLEKIGEGGMGVVWMAQQEEPVRRKVALKILKPGLDTREVIARFEAERQALALMDHPNIAKVFDGGATPQCAPLQQSSPALLPARPYFVMELVRGLPVNKYCDEIKMPQRQRLELFAQVCRAVQHAHQKGIIHRDLKPSNILVTEQDGQPVPKVIDFGIAKATEGRLTDKTLFTGFAQLLGTPTYMSPEQAGLGSLDIDTRSDIYSLGMVLYELLTGCLPFDPKDLLKQGYDVVLRTIREVDPPKPSTRLKQARLLSTESSPSPRAPLSSPIDHDLDWIVMKCLEKDRARRYDTPNSLAIDLERYLHDEPVLARPPSALYRWRKFARKYRAAVTAAATILVLLIVATSVSTVLALWANRERARAKNAQQAEIGERQKAEVERNRAKRAEGDAKDSEAETRSVLDFFQNTVLAAVRPEGVDGGLGPEVSLRAAVDAAESAIASAFAERPLAEAAIRHTLGTTYYHLGDFKQAIRQQERAFAIRKDLLGTNDPVYYESVNSLALAYHDAGRLQEAIALHEEHVRWKRAVFGPEHRRTLTANNNLAEAYLDAGNVPRALALHEETLKLRTQHLGATHQETLLSMNNLARAYGKAGRTKEAVALYEKALELEKAQLGPEHPQTLTTMGNLAGQYEKVSRQAEALKLHQQTLELRSAKLGPTHSSTISAMSNLSGALLRAGQTNEAVELGEKVLEARKAHSGLDHPYTLTAAHNLAAAYRKTGQLERALKLFQETVQLSLAKRGASHPDTLSAMEELARTYLDAGQTTNALPLLEDLLRQRESAPGSRHLLDSLNLLGGAYKDTRQFERAEPLLLKLYELLNRRLAGKATPTNERYVRESCAQLVQLYEAWGKPAEATQWRATLEGLATPKDFSAP